MKLNTGDYEAIAKRLLAHESFRTKGELCGIAKPVWFDHGKMSIKDYGTLQSDKQAYGIDYVIYSYETPIAWLFNKNGGTWVMPEADYSVTTKRHKATIRAAIQEYKKALNNAKEQDNV